MGSVAGRYYYTMELPGHVSGLVDSTGVVVNRYLYSAFGKAEVLQEGVPNTLRYMAREWDADAGLYYVRNRWYDPEVGRFISEDPIGIAGGINLYVYVGNDPVNSLDPYGLVGGSCVAVLQAINLHPDVIDRICGTTKVLRTVNVVYRWPFGTPRNDGRSAGFGNANARGGNFPRGRTDGPGLDFREIWDDIRNLAAEVGPCAVEHYGLTGLFARGASWLGAVPIDKRAHGLPVLPGASEYSNALNVYGHRTVGSLKLPGSAGRFARRALGSNSLVTLAGRANLALAAGFLAYDAVSIGICVAEN